jgi:hypothetical protein
MFDQCSLIEYHKEFRTALFISGFTIGTFLFSMKTFILKTLKDDFYDNVKYQERVRQRKNLGQNVGFYTPLLRFSKLLYLSIILSFFSALSQISIGYVSNFYAVLFCLSISFISWLMVGVSVYYVSINWSKIIDQAEKEAEGKAKKNVETKREET